MSKPPELWAFILANTGLFVISSVLTVLTYLVYRQKHGETSYLLATIGFGFVVLGGLVEPGYQLVVWGDRSLNYTELLWLQAGEGLLIASGLGLLFYSITHYDTGASSTEEETYKFGPQETDD